MTDAIVKLWGTNIGAISWVAERNIGIFQYEPDFIKSGIELSPIKMPLRDMPYEFPELPREAFKGLPGLLADSLPDKFGNAIIDAWLARQGREASSFNPVERLCYIGERGMGALEFQPNIINVSDKAQKLEIEELVNLANEVLQSRESLYGKLTGKDDRKELENIIRVGTSAGGARAKAILAWNPQTGEFRSGQIKADDGFTYWLLKFDGVSNNFDKETADPQGFGKIEYAFYLMALDAQIDMSESRLFKEGGRAHFMTKRFDRDKNGKKLHMQSLAALQHYDLNMAGAYSYEQAINTIRALKLPRYDIEQQFRRAVLNILIRNQDDHVKNIAFLMNRTGEWRLSPAFDVAYAYNPNGQWTSQHQMSLNGKRDNFTLNDLIEFARFCEIKSAKAKSIIGEIEQAVGKWFEYAEAAGISSTEAKAIDKYLRKRLG
ncbi:type II toxin-antitoxin system HipA family toxin [Pseudaquidulcibacter saccharophilus]|uniref:type II toxin-antitoxin system HipA family toxin n=1 Tax=Pseudaquidulcibacter saccharophilus TaxID=2831900 RepID=UPI001EFEF2A1|nr:type II toxin-antitoxin system HipA family toxin [Pseudaquidulcibacter saccharophilus]